MNALYPFVADRANHRCEYCCAPEEIYNFLYEVEHIVPIALGGSSEESNLALACRACNIYKSSFVTGVDEIGQTDVRLFHPRTDIWRVHFHVNLQSAIIEGLTPIGRATVSRLQLNHASQITARRLWIELRLFP